MLPLLLPYSGFKPRPAWQRRIHYLPAKYMRKFETVSDCDRSQVPPTCAATQRGMRAGGDQQHDAARKRESELDSSFRKLQPPRLLAGFSGAVEVHNLTAEGLLLARFSVRMQSQMVLGD